MKHGRARSNILQDKWNASISKYLVLTNGVNYNDQNGTVYTALQKQQWKGLFHAAISAKILREPILCRPKRSKKLMDLKQFFRYDAWR